MHKFNPSHYVLSDVVISVIENDTEITFARVLIKEWHKINYNITWVSFDMQNFMPFMSCMLDNDNLMEN